MLNTNLSFSLCPGYGLGKQFTQHHEVITNTATTQDSEKEPTEDTIHLVSTTYCNEEFKQSALKVIAGFLFQFVLVD